MNSNLLSALMTMGQPKQIQNINQKSQQLAPPIDQERMRQMLPNLTKENLVRLVQQARQQGIPDEQIEQGLNFLLSIK